jgi:hypothetical protein
LNNLQNTSKKLDRKILEEISMELIGIGKVIALKSALREIVHVAGMIKFVEESHQKS